MNPSRMAKTASSTNGTVIVAGLSCAASCGSDAADLRGWNRFRRRVPAPVAEKDVTDLARHVEGREQCADRAEIKRYS